LKSFQKDPPCNVAEQQEEEISPERLRRLYLIDLLKKLNADTQEERDIATEELSEYVTEDDIPFLESQYYSLKLEQRWRLQAALVPLGWIPLNCRETLERELPKLLDQNSLVRLSALSALVNIPNINDQIQEVIHRPIEGEFELIFDFPEITEHTSRLRNVPCLIELNTTVSENGGFWATEHHSSSVNYIQYYQKFSDPEPRVYIPELFGFPVRRRSPYSRIPSEISNIHQYRYYRANETWTHFIEKAAFKDPGIWLFQVTINFSPPLRGLYYGTRSFSTPFLDATYYELKTMICFPREEAYGKVLIEADFNDMVVGEEVEFTLNIENRVNTDLELLSFLHGWYLIRSRRDDGFWFGQIRYRNEETQYLEEGETFELSGKFRIPPGLEAGRYDITLGIDNLLSVSCAAVSRDRMAYTEKYSCYISED